MRPTMKSMQSLLLVDDHAGVRDVLRLHAESHGFDVVGEAVDGPEGIELAERLDPDAVILDHTMPTMTGLVALRALRQRAPRAVVVMYSSDASIKGAAIAAGATACFTKTDSPRAVITGLFAVLEAATL
jgi:DNA-binding NarL/FixJ family response regulator